MNCSLVDLVRCASSSEVGLCDRYFPTYTLVGSVKSAGCKGANRDHDIEFELISGGC